MEAMSRSDIEVLFCFEPYDELVLLNLAQFDRKNLKSVENELDAPTPEVATEQAPPAAGVSPLSARNNTTLDYLFYITGLNCTKRV